VGWLLDRNLTNEYRFAPDLLADRDMQIIHRLFGVFMVISMLMPPLVGGLITWSWHGALTAFFWASLVRLAFQQHVTWSVNSLCHVVGERPFASRDRSTNLWPLAILSFGDSWHNLHHADPTCARHGVDPWQVDISGRVIWLLEKLGFAYDVRWPSPARLARMRSETSLAVPCSAEKQGLIWPPFRLTLNAQPTTITTPVAANSALWCSRTKDDQRIDDFPTASATAISRRKP